jgi:hypothetical protein
MLADAALERIAYALHMIALKRDAVLQPLGRSCGPMVSRSSPWRMSIATKRYIFVEPFLAS